MNLIPITDDLYGIADRLQSICATYRVFYNGALNRYEVHDVAQHGDTLAFIPPYAELDDRTVKYAGYTRRQNADCVFADIERHNAQIRAQAVKDAVSTVSERVFKEKK